MHLPLRIVGTTVLLLAIGCASESAPADNGQSLGGSASNGGASVTGGAGTIGGTVAVGGSSSGGGSTPTSSTSSIGGNVVTGGSTSVAGASAIVGGANGTGGLPSTGGNPTVGGTGTASTGGSPATGGAVTVAGGSSATGGSAPTGGTKATATGGSVGLGGTSSTGGKAAGGATSTGGIAATGGASTLTTGGTTGVGGTAANAPNPADILATMKKVTAYEIQLGPEIANWVNKWTEATFYIGVMAAYLATNDQTYLTDATNWGTKNSWTLLASPTRSADNQCAGQVYEDIYLANPIAANAKDYANTKTDIDAMVAAPRPGINQTSSDWWWCDALFMAPGVVSRLGKITGQASYYSFLDTMWASVQAGLLDTKTGLFWRDSTFVNGTVYWSRGNGWVMGGLVRILEYLPATDGSYNAYKSLLTTMAAAVKPWQQSDGTWHADLTHPTKYPNPEVSGTGLITYALAYGINQGLLDRATYQPVVFAAWKAMNLYVDTQGRVGYIQATGSAPAAATATETHDYGVGAFLLAGSEIYNMVK